MLIKIAAEPFDAPALPLSSLGSVIRVAPLQSPDPRARFEDMVRQYGRLIAAVVARVGGARTSLVRDDIHQQVLIGLWRQVEREQTIEHPASYLYRAAVRETVRALRREAAREAEPLEDVACPRAQGSDDPYQAMAAREQASCLEAGLLALAPDRGRAVRGHLQGFDVTEIMRHHGWTYQKTRNLIARGMADLRRALIEKGLHA
jgi:DNA-directed RNA polymerase specialized sigma24 family protein